MTATRWSVPMVLVVFALGGSRADAQERSGLMGGLSLGGGALDFSGASSDPAVELVSEGGDQGFGTGFNLYLGASTSPRTAILFEVAFIDQEEDVVVDGEVRVGANRVTFPAGASTQTAIVFAGALQYWLTSRVWVRGGFGAGVLDRDLVIAAADLSITLTKSLGFATLAAAGVEFWRRGNFAMDAQFHFTSFGLEGLRINAPSGQVGFTWY